MCLLLCNEGMYTVVLMCCIILPRPTHFLICSVGFAVINSDDNEIKEDGKAREIACGTEKGKHKCKNQKSAGNSFVCMGIQITRSDIKWSFNKY